MLNDEIGIVILAAGGSSRLGEPKQLLEFEGKTLLRRAAENALQCQVGPVLVVLGNDYEKIRNEISDLPVDIFLNLEWGSGIASSIVLAVRWVQYEEPHTSAVIFTLCDQPRVDDKTILRLIQEYRSTGAKIVASEYSETAGVPALFDASLFEELMTLTGDTGAKSLITRYSTEALTISAPEAAFDIDSLGDYRKLIS